MQCSSGCSCSAASGLPCTSAARIIRAGGGLCVLAPCRAPKSAGGSSCDTCRGKEACEGEHTPRRRGASRYSCRSMRLTGTDIDRGGGQLCCAEIGCIERGNVVIYPRSAHGVLCSVDAFCNSCSHRTAAGACGDGIDLRSDCVLPRN